MTLSISQLLFSASSARIRSCVDVLYALCRIYIHCQNSRVYVYIYTANNFDIYEEFHELSIATLPSKQRYIKTAVGRRRLCSIYVTKMKLIYEIEYKNSYCIGLIELRLPTLTVS